MNQVIIICSFGGMWRMTEEIHHTLELVKPQDLLLLPPVQEWLELESLLEEHGTVNLIIAVCAAGTYEEPISLLQEIVEERKCPDAYILFVCPEAIEMDKRIKTEGILSTRYFVTHPRLMLWQQDMIELVQQCLRKSHEVTAIAIPRGRGSEIPNQSSHVFIAYVRENTAVVDRLHQVLTAHGIKVWHPRYDIPPGNRWRLEIRRAIRQGSFFIACFSKEYSERESTYMNEELTLAIEELRKRPTDRTWFIPLKLSECEIPDRDIGAGETLQDLHYVELYEEYWDDGIQRILSVIQPT